MLDDSDIKNFENEISNVESAKKVCAIELSQIFGGDRNAPGVKKICDCIVDNVPLVEMNRNGVLKADKTITNKCIGS